jgi:transcription antitermination factor NusG
MIRLQDNPPQAWPARVAISDPEHYWTVAYCKPRQEKALGWDLLRREVPYFLPMVYREKYSGGRRRPNLYPLFPSYLFFSGAERERLSVLRTERVLRLIEISPPKQAEFRQEIASLETALERRPGSLELYPRIVSGARVRITAGPMKDVEGIVLQAANKRKLWLGVSVLGVGATIEIHADLVDVV